MTSSNPVLRRTSVMLERLGKKQKAPIWKEASSMLSGPTKARVEVNLGRISRLADAGDAVFVPGKVLGTGVIDARPVVGNLTGAYPLRLGRFHAHSGSSS